MPAAPAPILLTGATGVLGLAVAARLLQGGHTLRALVRDAETARSLLPAEVELVEGSIEDLVALEDAVRGCQACVHMAGLVQFDDRHKQQLLETNHGGTLSVVNACLAEESLRHLIHIGSVAALPLSAADELTIPRPGQYSSYYGYTKRLSELEVHRGAAEGLGFTILRPSVVLGRHPQQRSSSSLIKLAARPVTACPPGELHWVAVTDVAEAVAQALPRGPENKGYILDATPTTWRQFFTTYRRLAGITGGRVITVPAGAIGALGWLSGMFSALLGLPIPSRRQLLLLLQDRTYPDSADAEKLMGRPYTGLEEAVRQLV